MEWRLEGKTREEREEREGRVERENELLETENEKAYVNLKEIVEKQIKENTEKCGKKSVWRAENN